MRKHHIFRFRRERGHKPAKEKSRSKSAEQLCYHKAGCIGGTNSGKCICERSRKRYSRIGKGSGSREPISSGDVKTDRYRNSFGAQTGTTRGNAQESECCDKFAEELPAASAGVL